jgi:septum formation protein
LSPQCFAAPEDHAVSSGFLSQGGVAGPPAPAASVPLIPRLLLASASPRRSQLLQTIGLPFTVVLNTMPEPEPTDEDHANPQHYVEALARGKAELAHVRDALEMTASNTLPVVISADTIVWHDGQILNKPRDEAEAVQMLSRLRGQSHQVLTGVCLRLLQPGEQNSDKKYFNERYFVEHETTTVRFRDVTDSWIRAYVATGEPLDKAGAYAAQGLGATIIEGIEGDFFNVVGLPLCRLMKMLERLGVPPETWWNRT